MNGAIAIGGTTFVDSSRNITNVGSITSPIIKGVKVVALTVTANAVSTDASLGNVFTFSNSAATTVNVPTNATDGQKCIWRFKNTDVSARAVTFASGAGGFRFGTTVNASSGALPATVAGKTDYIGAIYNGTDSVWDVIAYAKGF